MNETNGPRLKTEERLAALREIEAISADLTAHPTIRTRGHEWEILGTGLSRCVDAELKRYESIPAGDLSEGEWRACLAVMRAEERRSRAS